MNTHTTKQNIREAAIERAATSSQALGTQDNATLGAIRRYQQKQLKRKPVAQPSVAGR